MTSNKQNKRTPYTLDSFAVDVQNVVTMEGRAVNERRRLAWHGTLDGVLTGPSKTGVQTGTMSRKAFGQAFGVGEGSVRHDIRRGRVLVERGEDSSEYAAIKGETIQHEAFAWLLDPAEKFTVTRFVKSLSAARKPVEKDDDEKSEGKTKNKRTPRTPVVKVTPADTVKALTETVAVLSKQAKNLSADQWQAVEAAKDALAALSAEYAAKVAPKVA